MISRISTATERLAVCSWSLKPSNPQDLLTKLKACGIRRVQLVLDPLRESPEIWGGAASLFQQNGISLVSGMVGCLGEDYSTLNSIRLTGGIAPDETWQQNLVNFEKGAEIAALLGLKLVTFHAGFLPHSNTGKAFEKIVARLEKVADIFASHELMLGLETGQETAESLAAFLSLLHHDHIGVNFDPANIILYDQGDPVVALRHLGPWLRQIHIKDATRTRISGTWGAEVPVGTGEVNWPDFFAEVRALNFTGNLVIEREAGDQRVADICSARELVLRHL